MTLSNSPTPQIYQLFWIVDCRSLIFVRIFFSCSALLQYINSHRWNVLKSEKMRIFVVVVKRIHFSVLFCWRFRRWWWLWYRHWYIFQICHQSYVLFDSIDSIYFELRLWILFLFAFFMFSFRHLNSHAPGTAPGFVCLLSTNTKITHWTHFFYRIVYTADCARFFLSYVRLNFNVCAYVCMFR